MVFDWHGMVIVGWGAGDVWRGSVGGIRSITVGSEPRGVDKKGVAIHHALSYIQKYTMTHFY